MKIKRNYSVMVGNWGGYGMSGPITKKRAYKLMRYAIQSERWTYGRSILLSACPSEVKYALNHGAKPEFRILIQ